MYSYIWDTLIRLISSFAIQVYYVQGHMNMISKSHIERRLQFDVYVDLDSHVQCCRFSQNIELVTLEIIYFHYQRMYLKDQSIQKQFYLFMYF